MDVASKRRRPLSFAGQILEEECPACRGTGDDGKYRGILLGLLSYQWCDNCSGKGYVLTHNGKVICDLILTHLTGDERGLRLKGSK